MPNISKHGFSARVARGREPKTSGHKWILTGGGGLDDKLPQVNLGTPLSTTRPLSYIRVAKGEEKQTRSPWGY